MALGQVSFDLPEGSITALIGPNGAGKTTMINVISCLYRPQEGEVFFSGSRDPTAASISLWPQWA